MIRYTLSLLARNENYLTLTQYSRIWHRIQIAIVKKGFIFSLCDDAKKPIINNLYTKSTVRIFSPEKSSDDF